MSNRIATKLRKGYEVQIITGKDKGKQGKIQSFASSKGRTFIDRVIVENCNIAKRHTKPNQNTADGGGGIIEKPMSIHVSNVMFVDPKTKKPTRLGYKFSDDKKVRFAKKSGEIL